MNRRSFLKLCNKFGLSAATYPLLHALPSLAQNGSGQSANNGKRFLAVYHPHGMHQPSFTSGVGHKRGNDFQLGKVLTPLEPVKSKTNVIEGVSWEGNPSGARHQYGMVGMLTGRDMGKEGFSIDQLVADNWKTQVLNLGVQVAPGLHNRKSNYENIRISFRGNRNAGAQRANNNPFSAFQQTFGSITPADPYESFASNRSVLDSLLDEIGSVQNRLSSEDRMLLESHQQNIRDIECRLHGVFCSDEIADAPPPVSACQPPALIAQPSGLDRWLEEQRNFPTIARLQGDIAAAALACQVRPVAVLQHATTESTVTYSWVRNERGDPATSGTHHDLSHSSYSSSGAIRDFTAIHKWYAEQVSRIAQQLDNIPEGDGTVLDNTLIYWVTCLGNSEKHWHNSWPIVTVGNAKGHFRTGQSLDYRRGGRCVDQPDRCFLADPSGTTHIEVLNTVASGLDLGATDDNPVVGNLDSERDLSYVGRTFDGLLSRMLA